MQHVTRNGERTELTQLRGEVSRLRAMASWSDRMATLQAITSELASALTLDDVAAIVTEHCAAAVGAELSTLWIVDELQCTVRLVRARGVAPFTEKPISADVIVAECVREGRPIFVDAAEYRTRYAASAAWFQAEQWPVLSVASLPLNVSGKTIGCLLVGLEPERSLGDEERSFLFLVAEHCAQALHRARLHAAEQRALTEAALLYELLDAIMRASCLDDIFAVALDVVGRALDVNRSAILLFDDSSVMRFQAWRGLSDSYRRSVEGHTPWQVDSVDARTIVVPDIEADSSLAPYLPIFRSENVGGLGFIPLVYQGHVIGKFMVYSESPRSFTKSEMRLVETIASQVALGVTRKRAETELQKARASAEQASRAKDEFLAVVSHELRTPLSTISGWVALLRKAKGEDAALLEKGLEVIERNVHSQTTLIEDILDVSRIVTGKLMLDARVVSIASIVEDVFESARPSATAKDIEVALDAPANPCSLVGDADRLRQIVWNLLSNAIKFTPLGGRVSVSLRCNGENVEVRVTDTGRGIEPAFLPFVFDRFRQADSSSTRQKTGLGLGLAIVRHLVELHGGEVRAESDGPGHGATFIVMLPVSSQLRRAENGAPGTERSASKESPDPPGVSLEGIRVLVVDDDADALEVLAAMLTSYGAETRAANSVASALVALRSFTPDVLLSDIGMPVEDGTTLVRRLRSEVQGGDRVATIALTAYAREEEAERVLRAGFDRHVAKPANPEALVALIRDLGKGGSARP